ncbi:MAG: DUF3300 domain-containing protein [Gammaproteobacteria bacterium]|nr:DUF3300 domain-containing protein [Gammaproteobacteria bacterium]
MSTRSLNHWFGYCWLALALAAWPAVGNAQVAVAEVEEIEEIPTATAKELEELVGPIALYPDDLLAIVLPASTFPLQIVEAARFLEDLESDPSLKPDEDWDDSVIALINYPEVVQLLNEDLDWTWRLGEAVVAQQADVISAIELFRDRAYAAGNLKSDDYQVVAHEGSAIQITPVEEDVIYVPYYEPESVVVYQPRPVYYYYPRAYPVYYYPYPEHYAFHHNYFWGVTTAFAIGWHSHHLNVFHHSYWGHPYYGHHYYNNWWYRRPDIHVYNNVYVRNNNHVRHNRYRHGDQWQPNVRRTVRSSDQRVTRTRYYPNRDAQSSRNTTSIVNTNSLRQTSRSRVSQRGPGRDLRQETRRPDVQFRERSGTPDARRSNQGPTRTTAARSSTRDRGQMEPRTTRPRAVTPRPSTEPRQTRVRQEQRRQPQVRQSQPRQVQARQTQTREPQARRSEPRQTQVRQAAPRQTQVRQAAPRQSQSRQSQSRPSQPKQSNASSHSPRSSERVARNSQSRSSRSSSRRDH